MSFTNNYLLIFNSNTLKPDFYGFAEIGKYHKANISSQNNDNMYQRSRKYTHIVGGVGKEKLYYNFEEHFY